MAKYTITITEEGGAVSVALAGDMQQKTIGLIAASALMRLMPEVIKGAARAVADKNCSCPACQAIREAGQASSEAKTTLH